MEKVKIYYRKKVDAVDALNNLGFKDLIGDHDIRYPKRRDTLIKEVVKPKTKEGTTSQILGLKNSQIAALNEYANKKVPGDNTLYLKELLNMMNTAKSLVRHYKRQTAITKATTIGSIYKKPTQYHINLMMRDCFELVYQIHVYLVEQKWSRGQKYHTIHLRVRESLARTFSLLGDYVGANQVIFSSNLITTAIYLTETEQDTENIYVKLMDTALRIKQISGSRTSYVPSFRFKYEDKEAFEKYADKIDTLYADKAVMDKISSYQKTYVDRSEALKEGKLLAFSSESVADMVYEEVESKGGLKPVDLVLNDYEVYSIRRKASVNKPYLLVASKDNWNTYEVHSFNNRKIKKGSDELKLVERLSKTKKAV